MTHWDGSPCGAEGPATDQPSQVRCQACLEWLREDLFDELLATENLALRERPCCGGLLLDVRQHPVPAARGGL